MSNRKPTKHPCVFGGSFIRGQVDPRVQAAFESTTGKKARFGDLRRIWRQRHCRTLNPYGSDTCPYREEDCAMAFLSAVETSLARASRNPVGYFRTLVHTTALDRAENKPLERDRGPIIRSDAQRSGHATATEPGPGEGSRVRGPAGGFVRLGDLLRSLDIGPREGPSPDGKASTE